MSPRPHGPLPRSRCCAQERSPRAPLMGCGGRARSGRTSSSAFPGRARSNSEAGGSRCRRAKWYGSRTKRRTRISRTRAIPGRSSGSASTVRTPPPCACACSAKGSRGWRRATGPELVAWFERLFLVLRRRDRSLDFHLNQLVSEFFLLMARSLATPALRDASDPLSAVVAAVRADIRRSWSATEIARLGGLSPSQIRRLFQKNLRESPRRWLIRERLIAAQSLMIRENAPIASIAEACGFCDVYHFGREFKRVVGASPAAWRRTELGARDMSQTPTRRIADRRNRST